LNESVVHFPFQEEKKEKKMTEQQLELSFTSDIDQSLEDKISRFLEQTWKDWGLEDFDPLFVSFILVRHVAY
jgi:hypothetical protein